MCETWKTHCCIRHFSRAKIPDMNHDKKATQEKSPAETTTHVGTSDVFSDKEQKDIANNIYNLLNQLRLTQTK